MVKSILRLSHWAPQLISTSSCCSEQIYHPCSGPCAKNKLLATEHIIPNVSLTPHAEYANELWLITLSLILTVDSFSTVKGPICISHFASALFWWRLPACPAALLASECDLPVPHGPQPSHPWPGSHQNIWNTWGICGRSFSICASLQHRFVSMSLGGLFILTTVRNDGLLVSGSSLL